MAPAAPQLVDGCDDRRVVAQATAGITTTRYHQADCAALVGGRPDERVGPDPPLPGPPPASNGGSADHRLHHPTLTERFVELGDDQRWCAQHHGLHRERSGQRHPLLLPGLRPQRRRAEPGEQHRQRHPAHQADGAPLVGGGGRRSVSGQIRLTWVAPASNGGAAITDYIIQRSPNGSSSWVTINDGVRNTTGYTVTGLANGTRYYFRVFARNAVGTQPGEQSRQRGSAHGRHRAWSHLLLRRGRRLLRLLPLLGRPGEHRRFTDHELRRPAVETTTTTIGTQPTTGSTPRGTRAFADDAWLRLRGLPDRGGERCRHRSLQRLGRGLLLGLRRSGRSSRCKAPPRVCARRVGNAARLSRVARMVLRGPGCNPRPSLDPGSPADPQAHINQQDDK